MAQCRDCGLVGSATEVRTEVCARCGAFEGDEGAGWVCFPCGGQNLVSARTCGCGRERSLECAACEAEIPVDATSCPECGVPRYAFASTEAGLERTKVIQVQRARAKRVALAVVPVALAGVVVLITANARLVRFAGGGLVACALAGMAHVAATERRTRQLIH